MEKKYIRTLTIAIFGMAGAASFNAPALAALPIRINVMIHDDVPHAIRDRLEADYLKPWVQEMELVTGRQIALQLSADVPGISDIDYRVQASWPALIAIQRYNQDFWERQGDGRWNYRLDKSLLLLNGSVITGDADGSEGVGRALDKGTAGWASIGSFATAGHELGHMFGATHEHAEVLFNGWFCETFTFPAKSKVRSNCYRYSDLNREAIRAYLSEAP